MLRLIQALVPVLLLLSSESALAEDFAPGNKLSLYSEVLQEDRQYWLSLPVSYENNTYRKYPVLYLLDADMNAFFATFSSMVKQMSADASPVIPEMIVVGIVSQQRVRDSSPTRSLIQYGGKQNLGLSVTWGGDKFGQFLTQELLTEIDKNYRTSDYRILTGYSFSGLTVLHSLFSYPSSFNAYLAIDPSIWWDNQVMLKRARTFLQQKQLNKRRLFVASSQRIGKVYPKTNYVIELINLLQQQRTPGLAFGSKIYGQQENHQTMPIPSFYQGLRFIFAGYMLDEEARFRSAAELEQHFQRVSQKLGTDLFVRESLLNYFAYNRLYDEQFFKDEQNAIEFFKLNTRYYPKSAKAWRNLGKGYLAINQKQQARQAYKQALALAPGQKMYQQELAAIK